MTINTQPLSKQKVTSKTLIKFALLLSVLAGYFGYLSWEYDLRTGGTLSAITWSFFVLCTPVADAGFLLDFPIRLITGVRMIITEIFVWGLAIAINAFALFYTPESYDKTMLTNIFYKILTTPIPYWSIIILCAIGTFLTIYFGDEVFDVLKKKALKEKKSPYAIYRILSIAVIFSLIVLTYYELIKSLGIDI